MDAIRKMSLMPAQVLEHSTPSVRLKGRLQEGADADVVIFDLQTITDRATYQHPMETSAGVEYLLVGVAVLVNKGKLMEGVFPARPSLEDNWQWKLLRGSEKCGVYVSMSSVLCNRTARRVSNNSRFGCPPGIRTPIC
jgi:hypothetical protein